MTRRNLPDRRAGATFSCRIDGHKVTMTCGEYEDGSLGEIFIDSFSIGSVEKAWVSQFCVMASLSLQYGTPLDKMVSIFTATRFKPWGMVTGDDQIKMTQSILDWAFKKLAINYLGDGSLAHVKG